MRHFQLSLPLALVLCAFSFAPDDLDAARQELKDLVQDGSAVGLVACLEREGQVVLSEVVGLADREEGAEMREDSIFRIFSMTKPITCVSALILYEEDLFELDDPVSRYLPELSELRVTGVGEDGKKTVPARTMKVRDLFQHTTGWSYTTPWRQAAVRAGKSDPSLADMVTALAEIPLEFQPGSRWEYGISHDVLGRLVEVLAEQPLDRFMAERIFEPLGMVDTGFHLGAEDVARLTQLYQGGSGGLKPSAIGGRVDPTQRPSYLSGGGGLLSTSGDYMRFLRMLLAGGELDGKRILSADSVELMTRDHIGNIPRSALLFGRGFGLGVAIQTQDSARGSVGTWSWGGAAGTSFWVDPKREEIGVFMVQNWQDFRPATRFQMALSREGTLEEVKD